MRGKKGMDSRGTTKNQLCLEKHQGEAGEEGQTGKRHRKTPVVLKSEHLCRVRMLGEKR